MEKAARWGLTTCQYTAESMSTVTLSLVTAVWRGTAVTVILTSTMRSCSLSGLILTSPGSTDLSVRLKGVDKYARQDRGRTREASSWTHRRAAARPESLEGDFDRRDTVEAKAYRTVQSGRRVRPSPVDGEEAHVSSALRPMSADYHSPGERFCRDWGSRSSKEWSPSNRRSLQGN